MDTVASALDSRTQHLLGRCAARLVSTHAGRGDADEALDVHGLGDLWRKAVVECGPVDLADDVAGRRYARLGAMCDRQSKRRDVDGVESLFLCLGYLALPVVDGRDGSRESVAARRAPLVMMPAELERIEEDGGCRYELLVAGAPFVNPMTALALRSGLGVETPVPTASYEGGIVAYLDAVEKLLATAPGRAAIAPTDASAPNGADGCWSLFREAGIVEVDGPELVQYRDLVAHAGRALRSALLSGVLPEAAPTAAVRDGEDARTAPAAPIEVALGGGAGETIDHDLLEGSDSFVLAVGPTGARDIQAALADLVARRVRAGRRVAFVAADPKLRAGIAEKLADFSITPLDLSGSASASATIASLRENGAPGPDADDGSDSPSFPVEPLHIAPQTARDRLAVLDDAPELPADALGDAMRAKVGSIEAEDLREALAALEGYAERVGVFSGGVRECPWYGATVERVDHDFRAEARTRLDELNLKAKQANITYQTMERETGMSFVPTIDALDDAAALCDHILRKPVIPGAWTLDTDFEGLERVRASWQERAGTLVARVHELHDRADLVLGTPTAAPVDAGGQVDGADALEGGRSLDLPAAAAGDAGQTGGSKPARADGTRLSDEIADSVARRSDVMSVDALGSPSGAIPSSVPEGRAGGAPVVGEVSEHPGYLDDGAAGDLCASAAIDRYAKLVAGGVADRIAADPCYSNWAASKAGDVEETRAKLGQFVNASANLRGMLLRDYAPDILGVDYAQMESRFSPEGASWFRRFFNFAHRRDLKSLARMRKPEAGGARNYRDADARDVLSRLRALATVRSNTEAGSREYLARFGSLYSGEDTDLAAIDAKMAVFADLVELRGMARDMESGIVWADLDSQGLDDAFGELYAGDAVATDWGGKVAERLAWAKGYSERAGRLGVSESEFARAAMGCGPVLGEELTEKCKRWSQRLHDSAASCRDHSAWFSRCFADPRTILSLSASDLAARADACVNDLRSLEHWVAYRGKRSACSELDLTDFADAAADLGIAPADLSRSFERTFWTVWLDWAEGMRTHEREVFDSLGSGVPARWIVSALPDLVTSALPCVVATPTSATSVFAEGNFMFDTVVFVEPDLSDGADDAERDEAVAEGLCALLRAHQAILVRGAGASGSVRPA